MLFVIVQAGFCISKITMNKAASTNVWSEDKSVLVGFVESYDMHAFRSPYCLMWEALKNIGAIPTIFL